MSGAYRGVQARVRMLYPLAIYTHCCSHVRNLVVSSASQLPSIRNAVLWQVFVCLFRDLRSVQLFCESSSKREHRRLVAKVNLYLCAKLAG